MKSKNKFYIFFFLNFLFIFVLFISNNYLKNLIFARSPVVNTKLVEDINYKMNHNYVNFFDESVYFGIGSSQKNNLLEFKKKIDINYSEDINEIEKIALIRRWVRDQQGEFSHKMWQNTRKIDNPLEALLEMQANKPGLCRRFAIVSMGAYLAKGFPVRLVFSAPDFRSKSYNHSIVEVWSQQYNKWIVVDATMDTFYLLDKIPAGLLEISEAVRNERFDKISFERNGSIHKPIPLIYFENSKQLTPFIQSFHHTFYSTNNALFDGYGVKLLGSKRLHFLHYYNENIAKYPTGKRKLALASLILSLSGIIILNIYCIYISIYSKMRMKMKYEGN
ncbi:transglutaminase-like domain-containing protein [Desulfobulbus alkaliphilus]|uniref:transglutaminase-like domain-containing protein n=1 Tax=Desulfobulbus alkaliphilus TaxID=869814 RepID=UPI001965C348|nr:transglutaminase-like domain-containing protein [Desulfobulbus alkaliphilus]MBM9538464.1 transglutaminase domain-containing protein [Desulfobulbus alkaliphilus]